MATFGGVSRAVLRNPDVVPGSPLLPLLTNDFWGTPLAHSGSHGSYRPLSVLSLRLSAVLAGGLRPQAFHLGNAVLHALAAWLVLLLARRLLRRWAATMSALLFAAHPVHAEAVAGVVGRADLLAAVFFLLALLCYVRHTDWRELARCPHPETPSRAHAQDAPPQDIINLLLGHLFLAPPGKRCPRKSAAKTSLGPCVACRGRSHLLLAASLVLATCSTLSKEPGVAVLGVCAVYELFIQYRRYRRGGKQNVRPGSLLSLGSWLVVLLGARLWLMGLRAPGFASADNPAAHSSALLTRTLTFLYLPVVNLRLLVWPHQLSFDWSMDSIPRVESLLDARNLLSAALYLGLFHLTRGALRAVVSYPEVSGVQRTRKASSRRTTRKSRLLPQETEDVPDNKMAACAVCDGDMMAVEHTAKCQASNNNNVGVLNKNQGGGVKTALPSCRCPKVEPGLQDAAKRSKTFRVSRVMLPPAEVTLLCLSLLVFPLLPATNLFFYVGFVVAERVLYMPSIGFCLLVAAGANRLVGDAGRRRRCLSVTLCVLLLVLSARTVLRNQDWHDEESLYRSGIPINPPKAYGNLGSVLSSMGRLSEAEHAFEMALQYRPNMADVHYNLGNLLARRGQSDAAIRSYQQAIRFRPSLALAYVNLGHVLASGGRVREAVEVLGRCAVLPVDGLKDPGAHRSARASALLLLGHLHAEQGDLVRARDVLQRALDTRPSDYQPAALYKLMAEVNARLDQQQAPSAKTPQTAQSSGNPDTQTSITAATPLNDSRCTTTDNRRLLSHS